MKTTFQALRILVFLTILTGVFYPLMVMGIAQVAFPWKASGSLIQRNDQLIGSELLAQKTASSRYFWPRPSAVDFATVASGASNKGPTSEDLRKAIAERRERYGVDAPSDLLTASGSGLDPHLSPAAALHQVARVAQARGLPAEKVSALVAGLIEPPQLGFLGEPRVNVLRLNLALDTLK
jgi:K+-transporting ATPase ATPase C chain